MLNWAQIPAWDDNYIYLVHDDKEAVVIDPTEADPVIDFLNDNNLKLNRIINTHHHPDHISGIDDLVHKYKVTVSCSKYDKNRVPHASIFFEPNDKLEILGSKVNIIDVSGHTLGQIAYHFPEEKLLFSGDCLFRLGCGYIFEGDPEMMQKSFSRIKDLPKETLICCSHEYTLANAKFQESIECRPGFKSYHEALKQLRKEGKFTVPYPLAEDLEWNLFLRWDDEELKKHLNIEQLDPAGFVAEIRQRKNLFKA